MSDQQSDTYHVDEFREEELYTIWRELTTMVPITCQKTCQYNPRTKGEHVIHDCHPIIPKHESTRRFLNRNGIFASVIGARPWVYECVLTEQYQEMVAALSRHVKAMMNQ